MRMLDLFCGRWGWSKAFAARGWECIGVDLKRPEEVPSGCEFVQASVEDLCILRGAFHEIVSDKSLGRFDFICASSPCEQFSVFGMPHFHPNPPYPSNGIELFNYTRELLWRSGIPWVMENVRTAQKFVGPADMNCGPFFLWGTGVPPLMPQNIKKGMDIGCGKMARELLGIDEGRKKLREYRKKHDVLWCSSKSAKRKEMTAIFAEIPPELANCVADYAERLLEQKISVSGLSGSAGIAQ